ncbi:MAG: hypothetical protein CSYNP_02910 [Syntrophus sp. SKADARSKE-3]|nr:hypothetical protein [Syntrophus sp. SKADARSKE-3]
MRPVITGKPCPSGHEMITKIISGGQTGADRAALDFAIKHNIPHGGWIPKGRLAEDGRLSDSYQLQEMPTPHYSKRTERNVLDSDGTVIVSHGLLKGGSALTREFAKCYGKPWLHLDLDELTIDLAAKELLSWLTRNDIKILNVAGPRGSENPKIYTMTVDVLEKALSPDYAN